jgi:Uma2 family endonuclease
MSATTAARLMTTEELLALPEDGGDRWLICGELQERPMTTRGPLHTETAALVSCELVNWLRRQPPPRGKVLSGEAGFRLRRDPDTTVGIDIAYISRELAAATPRETRMIDGHPILAVEILSPSNKWEDVQRKIQAYLDAGVPLTWVLDPVLRTVTVYRPDEEHELFTVRKELAGDPHLPGFRVAVAALFG